MRLIDADPLKEKAFFHEIDNVSYVEEEDIDNAPTVDAVERKRGRWIDLGKDRAVRWQCSECGRKDTHIYNYCPDCGADMGDENNG